MPYFYDFTTATAFPNNVSDVASLHEEIRDAALGSATLQYVHCKGSGITRVAFDVQLSGADETTLGWPAGTPSAPGTIIGDHQGIASMEPSAEAVDINGLTADATPDGAADYVMTYDASDTKNKKVLLDNLPGGGGGGGTFGSEHHHVEANTETTTTSSTYQQKVRLTTSALPAGDYYIAWSAEGASNSASKSAEVRLQENDTTTIGEVHTAEGSALSYYPLSGFCHRTLSGVTTFDIDYRCGSGGMTAYIRNARIVLWRVS